MKKGFVVSAILYPLLVIALALFTGLIVFSDNRRKILDNMKLEVTGESETDPEMSNSSLYYKMQALEEAYAEMATRVSEERFEEIKADYDKKIADARAYTDAAKNSAITTAKSQTKLEANPVGSIYISSSATNPSSYIGGTWVAYGQGRTLVGVGSGTDTNSTTQTYAAGATGGTYTHKLTAAEMPSHTHTMSHTHTTPATSLASGSATTVSLTGNMNMHNAAVATNIHGATGIFSAGNTNPRYGNVGSGISGANSIGSVYINASHSHSVTGTIPSMTTNSINTTTTGGAGSNGMHNNVQPYIAVYIWRRTA